MRPHRATRFALLAVAALAVTTVLAAAPASAAPSTTGSRQPATDQAAQFPSYFTIYYGCLPGPRCTWSVVCNAGTTHQIPLPVMANNQGSLNQCEDRVWLHQNPDGSGYALCINPGSATGPFHRTYQQLLISNNTANC
jgi:hypothetical protein